MSPDGQVRTEAQVVAASQHDPAQFATLYDRHAGDIHRYLLRRLGADVAEDLTADTFVVAFRSRGRFDPAQPGARPWLYGIASNLAARFRRSEVRGLRARRAHRGRPRRTAPRGLGRPDLCRGRRRPRPTHRDRPVPAAPCSRQGPRGPPHTTGDQPWMS